MIFDFFEGIWNLFLFFAFVFAPFVMLIGFLQKRSEIKEEMAAQYEKKSSDTKSPKEETPSHGLPVETYRTVKKEPGAYSVFGPGGREAIVIKVETPSDGKYWIAILASREGKKSERVKTKKEAVALAIELLKEEKESKNGS